MLVRILRPIVAVDQPRGHAELLVVLVYVASEDGEDVFIQNGGSHRAVTCYFSNSISLSLYVVAFSDCFRNSRSLILTDSCVSISRELIKL